MLLILNIFHIFQKKRSHLEKKFAFWSPFSLRVTFWLLFWWVSLLFRGMSIWVEVSTRTFCNSLTLRIWSYHFDTRFQTIFSCFSSILIHLLLFTTSDLFYLMSWILHHFHDFLELLCTFWSTWVNFYNFWLTLLVTTTLHWIATSLHWIATSLHWIATTLFIWISHVFHHLFESISVISCITVFHWPLGHWN